MARCPFVLAWTVLAAIAPVAGCMPRQSRGPGFQPSEPGQLAWLAHCGTIVVCTSPPFVAPADGELTAGRIEGVSQEQTEQVVAAHRLRLRDSVGQAVATHLRQVLPEKDVRYLPLSGDDPYAALSGLTPTDTALCSIHYEVILEPDKPFVVREMLPIFFPLSALMKRPPNAISPAGRRFTESGPHWLRRAGEEAGDQQPAGIRGPRLIAPFLGQRKPSHARRTSAAELRAALKEWQAWKDTCWTARAAPPAIYTLAASPTSSKKRVGVGRFIVMALAGRISDALEPEIEMRWDLAELEVGVATWADQRGADLAQQVSAALRLGGGESRALPRGG